MNNLHIYTTRAFQDDPELKKYNPEKEEEVKNKDVMYAIFGDDYLRYLVSKKR